MGGLFFHRVAPVGERDEVWVNREIADDRYTNHRERL